MHSIDWQKDYPNQPPPHVIESLENNSLAQMLRLVPTNSEVLEFGCATGYFSHLLERRGCKVTGVEINTRAAEKARAHGYEVLVADLDFTELGELLGTRRFDVATFGDVLEHLRDPWRLLARVRDFLNPGGVVVASIPNIAHGAVRLALLEGHFEYTTLGLLDNTHLRHFTATTVGEMFTQAGYYLNAFERTTLPYRDASDLLPSFDIKSLDRATRRRLDADPEANTLQFVVRACPGTLPPDQLSLPLIKPAPRRRWAW